MRCPSRSGCPSSSWTISRSWTRRPSTSTGTGPTPGPIIPDPNAVVANLLGGEIDSTVSIALGQQAGATMRDEWAKTGDGTVLAIQTRFRYVDIQFNPTYSEQPALQDVRVRRAMLHSLD